MHQHSCTKAQAFSKRCRNTKASTGGLSPDSLPPLGHGVAWSSSAPSLKEQQRTGGGRRKGSKGKKSNFETMLESSPLTGDPDFRGKRR